MTPIQKLTIERAELQNKLNSDRFVEIRTSDPDAETRIAEAKALRDELHTLNEKMIEAVKADADTTPEAREWADVSSRFDLGEMFTNVTEHRASDGAIAEVQKERGLGANDIPTEMLMEQRAVTPAPSDVGQSQSEITGYVFPQSVAAFMGIPSPIVPVGDATFPVLTSDPAAGVPAENAAQAETTGAFTADVLTPKRIQASFFWSREDAARMAGMGDALREALQGGIADKLDKEIIQGTNGLLTGTILSNNARGSASDYAHYVSALLYGRVDGQYAYDLADIRVVMGAATFGNASTKLPSAGEENALARIRNDSGGVRVTAHVPAVASMKQNAIVRLGTRRDYVAPVWGAVTLIPDEITLAGKGQIQLTAVLLYAAKLLRSGGFSKQETNHS